MIAPLPANELQRLGALDRYKVLDTGPEPAFDDIAQIASILCQAPTAMVTLIDEKRQWFKARVGLNLQESSRDLAFCAHCILQRDVMIVPDATKDERFADNGLVTGNLQIRFYAGAPLITEDGFTLGSVSVLDYIPRNLNPQQREGLAALSRQAVALLEARRALMQQIVDEKIRENEQRLRALFEQAAVGVAQIETATGRFVRINQKYCEIVGYSAEEMVEATFQEITHPDDLAADLANMERIKAGEIREFVMEKRYLRTDGSLVWVNLTVSPMWATGATPDFHIAVVEDISARKIAEREFENSKAMLEAIRLAQMRFISEEHSRKAFDDLLQIVLNLTGSEYGFIGEVLRNGNGDPYLKAYAITNIAWNEQTRAFFEQHAPAGLEFHNLKTLFGEVMTTAAPVIANDPANDPRSGGLPPGHPPMSSFLGLPFFHGTDLLGMIGIANRQNGYDTALIERLGPFLATCANLVAGYRGNRRRVEAEEALRNSEERFRAVVEHASDGIFIADPKGIYIDANSAGARLLGMTREEVIGRHIQDVVAEEEASRLTPMLQRLVDGGTILEEWVFRRSDGTTFPGEISAKRLPDGRLIGSVRDITERKRFEAELRLRSHAVEHALNGFDIVDEQGLFVYANLAYLRMWGYSDLQEIVGTSPVSHCADPTTPERIMGELKATGESTLEFTARRKDGSTFEVLMASRLLEVQGRVMFMSTSLDITDRKRAAEQLRENEERFRSVAESLSEGLILTDLADVVLYVNPRVTELTGYAASEMVGRPAYELLLPRERWAAAMDLGQKLSKGAREVFQTELSRKNGSPFFAEIHTAPLRNADGQVFGKIGAVTDITARLQLEAQLRQSQKMESVGQLAGGVAHDFNNLLTVIQGHVSLLAEEKLSADAASYTQEIGRASARAANLTRQLLAFSRKQMLQPKDVDLNEIVTNLTRMLHRLLGEDISLQLVTTPGLPLIRADVGMVEQVLVNLAVNSRDAMPKGGRLIIQTMSQSIGEEYVLSNPDATAGSYVRLRVVDSGHGIPAEHLAHVFEPFFTTKEVGKGTGLGLATVYGIVKQHRGWATVCSEPGRGATFDIFWPASPNTTKSENTGFIVKKVKGGNELILIVEDEESVRLLARTILQRHGYKVLEAENGQAALALWAKHQKEIDLVLTDMIMPGGIGGQELAERFLKERPELKVIYSSGYSADLLGDRSFVKYAAQYLQKPYEPSKLARAVRECLDYQDPS